jgi:uncharacterized protein
MKKILLAFIALISFNGMAQNFDQKEVEFWDLSHSFKLSGTLTIPKNQKKFPTAILISGSGQSDRDETIGKHKIFKTLAEYLSNNGIAVLRYDDRGGYKSGGPSTSKSTSYDLAKDVEAAYIYLKKEEKLKNIGLIGHSEGGGIGPLVLEEEQGLDFFVSMAGPAVKGKKLLITQNRAIYSQMGVKSDELNQYLNEFFEPVIDVVLTDKDSTAKANEIKQLGTNFREKYPKSYLSLRANASEKSVPAFMSQLNSEWYRAFLNFDPIQSWSKINCPTLALNGSIDLQVDPSDNLRAIESLKKTNIQTKLLKDHNHLFQIGKTGSTMEYFSIKEDISDEALNEIKSFILNLKL